jgi:hypothetical protein
VPGGVRGCRGELDQDELIERWTLIGDDLEPVSRMERWLRPRDISGHNGLRDEEGERTS